MINHFMAHEHFSDFGLFKIRQFGFAAPVIGMGTRVIHGQDFCIVPIAVEVGGEDALLGIIGGL